MSVYLSSGKRLALLATLVLLLVSCHHPASAPVQNEITPVKKWEFVTGHLRPVLRGDLYDEQHPAIASDGTIYAGGSRGLYALHPDGTQAWFYNNPYQSDAYPLHFVVIDDHGDIWSDVTSTLTPSGGAIHVSPDGQDQGGIGSIERVSQIAEALDGSVLVDGQIIDISGKGATVGRYGLPGYFHSFGPDGTPYASGGDLVALGTDHNAKWSVSNASFGEPVVANDGTIYVGSLGALLAVNPDGTGKWSFTVAKQLVLSPAVADDGTVYFGSDDGNLYALSPDGRLKWKFAAGGPVHCTPALAKNGTIYFGAGQNLDAVGADGKLKWKFATAGQVFSPTIADEDGTIYFQNAEAKLFAIQDLEPNGGLFGQWPKRGAGVRNTARAPH